MVKYSRLLNILYTSFLLLVLQSCSFHLRDTTALPESLQQLAITGTSDNTGLQSALQNAIEEAGGKVDQLSASKIRLTNIREGKRIVAYNSERKARIYLISLKFNYSIFIISKVDKKLRSLAKQRISLDKTFLYDANFALGKVKEEDQIRESLYAEAARLILLRLKYQ